MNHTAIEIAVVGAGPVGLTLALYAARTVPRSRISLFDSRPIDHDIGRDPRVLALALGSVQLLERLRAWPATAAAPINEVDVSQADPAGIWTPGAPGATRPWGRPRSDARRTAVRLRAADLGVPMLGAVLRYGELVAALQAAWLEQAAAAPERLRTRFVTAVTSVASLGGEATLHTHEPERFDLVVVAEGGVFAEQARKSIRSDYAQTAWVGTVTLETPAVGVAFERFTPGGPVALLPLPQADQAALVWCMSSDDPAVRDAGEFQRIDALNRVLPPDAGRVVAISALKPFALGLNAERSLVDARVVRIGNAAQTLHPVAGQGLNLGLRDAYELVAQLRFTDDIDAALRRVERSRAPDRWAMIAATDFLARSFTWRLPGMGLARSLALAALEALAPAKSALARQMMFGLR